MKNYTKIINESKDVYALNEGLWSKLVKALEFRYPKHPRYRALVKRLNEGYYRCSHMYAPKETKVGLGGKYKDFDVDFEYSDYEENPERIRCMYEVQLAVWKEIIKFYGQVGPEGACKYNKNKPRCMKFVQQELEEMKDEIKDIERELKQMARGKMNRQKFNSLKRYFS
jgi:hypothetical protein